MPMSADYLPISVSRPALFAREAGEGGFAFYISIKALDTIAEDGPPWKFEDARTLLKAGLELPTIIFEGLKRAEFTDGYCYVSRPTERWAPDGTREPTPQGRVFLIFVKKAAGLVVFDWEWRPACGLPDGHEQDFARLIWKT